MEALAAALAPWSSLPEAELLTGLRGDPVALARQLRASSPRRLVLFVDQLEELLTLAESDEGARAAEALAALAGGVPQLRLLGTVRSDFLARLGALPRLGDGVTRALYLLRPLCAEAIREAVVEPAALAGVEFESSQLVDVLVASAAQASGALPLLQFALAQLWEGRDVARGLIRAEALTVLGGVAGALARYADRVLALLLPEHRPLARKILTALVTADDTRARRTADELFSADQPGGRAVLEALVQGRLVTAEDCAGDAAPTYQIAHDALVDGWDTLRGWRGHEVERGAALQRLRRAADEWHRLGRPSEALWNSRQLAEAQPLDEGELGPTDAAFVRQSRQLARRRRFRQRVLVLGVPLLLGMGYGVARWSSWRHVTRAVRDCLLRTDGALASARSDEQEVERLRARALDAFDHRRSSDGESLWQQALQVSTRANAAYALGGQLLEQALMLDGSRSDVRRRLGGLLEERAQLAERDNKTAERDELAQRMLAYDDDGSIAAAWKAPAQLTLRTEPSGAEVTMQRYLDEPVRSLGPAESLGQTPIAEHRVAPGSYLMLVRNAGRPEVRYPILVARGERLSLDLALPGKIPDGYAYVPPGRFLYGEAEEAMRAMMGAQPLHQVWTGGYLIARHEVTFAEWLAFLRTLSPEERINRRPHTPVHVNSTASDAFLELVETGDGGFRLRLQPTTRTYSASIGEPIRYPGRTPQADQNWLRMPVSAISWGDARAYTTWLDRTGLLPGARPCDEHEWERAARGADERLYPIGNQLSTRDANFDETYGQQPLAFGPDEVGSHPASDSPFGVADLAGNVWELVSSVSGMSTIILRGGSWYHNRTASRANYRDAADSSLRAMETGLRVCSSVKLP
jgi:formylglycine-generating enzyme required for sulfatase activity